MAQHMENIIKELTSEINNMNKAIVKQSENMEQLTHNMKNVYDATLAGISEVFIKKHETNVLLEMANFNYYKPLVTNATNYKQTAGYTYENEDNKLLATKNVTLKGTGSIYLGLKYKNSWLANNSQFESFKYGEFNYVAQILNGMMFRVSVLKNGVEIVNKDIGSLNSYIGGIVKGGQVYITGSVEGYTMDVTTNMDVEQWRESLKSIIESEKEKNLNIPIDVKTGDVLTINIYVPEKKYLTYLKHHILTPLSGGVSDSDKKYTQYDTNVYVNLVGEMMSGIGG